MIDIERPVQTGYTMRTIEMLGASRKLITTNPRVAEADFYRPENVLVVDRHQPVIPSSFLNAEFNVVPEHVLARYTLEGWLDDVVPHVRPR